MAELNDVLDEQKEETRAIIEELLEDGSDPDALYAIEHHISSEHFEKLEKAAIEAFKLGYEVSDAEEFEVEDGSILLCCDVISECGLNPELIDAQVEQLVKLAAKMDVNYDGWGTYFEDPDGQDDDDSDDDNSDSDDEDDQEKQLH